MTREFAPAKINLTLHVTGQRADGYHLLDSLVVFAGVGDTVALAQTGFHVDGPFGDTVPPGPDNLVRRAARAVGYRGGLRLTKVLPPASGIGGGSSDAAATLRLLGRDAGRPLPGPASLADLGADVPVCMQPRGWRMRGLGEVLDPAPALPALWLVLVNPGVQVSTPAVFRALARRDNAPMGDIPTTGFLDWLAGQRNDLEPAARGLAPVIGEVLAALRATPACLLARMSGSGATCFGLYADEPAARDAAAALARPGWWIAAASMIA